MISTNQFKNGLSIVINNELYTIVEFQHIKPGKGGAFVRTKLRQMKTGRIIDKTFRAGEKVQDAFIETKKLQYSYRMGDLFYFMDLNSFDEIVISESFIGEAKNFLKENIQITASMHDGKIVGIELPTFVVLRIEHAEPGVRGDTAKSGTKSARLETGVTIQVPLFVNTGDSIRVDTRSGEYVERA